MSTRSGHPATAASPCPPQELESVRKMVQACIQCGTCTASCPNAFAMDLTPRQLWHQVLLGHSESVFNSRTFTLCSACYSCTLRCPRGLPLTAAMHGLKRAAVREGSMLHRPVTAFFRQFLQSVRRAGRVNEIHFMALYLAELRNPLLALRFSGVGLRLMAKGKLPLRPHRRSRPLEALFRRTAEVEEGR